MSISIFTLPTYKDLTYVSTDCYLEGKASSCHETELEDFLPIWKRMNGGKFPGSLMKLKKRIYDKEYSMYPIVFITSECWPETEIHKSSCSTTVHVVQKQNQNVDHCKTFEHRYIDREIGVIICEKTILHDGAKEPSFRNWFYDKDTRTELPKDILFEDFSNEKAPNSYFMKIEKFITDEKYDTKVGYLSGFCICNLFTEFMSSEPITCSISFIEWDDSWNFVIHDYYGQKMFKVKTEDALAFFERNGITFDEPVTDDLVLNQIVNGMTKEKNDMQKNYDFDRWKDEKIIKKHLSIEECDLLQDILINCGLEDNRPEDFDWENNNYDCNDGYDLYDKGYFKIIANEKYKVFEREILTIMLVAESYENVDYLIDRVKEIFNSINK